MEKEKLKETEPAQQAEDAHYDESLDLHAEAAERARTGKIVIRGKESPWKQNRMGYIKRFLSWHGVNDTATREWVCFIHDVKAHSGKHRHQGGLLLFVLDGEGYTVVDGQQMDWEKWDLIVLPVKPQGCEHQHFNKTPGTTARWMAFWYHPFSYALGGRLEHREDSPDWKGKPRGAST